MDIKHVAKRCPEEPYAVMSARTESVGALGEQSPKATRSLLYKLTKLSL